MSCEQLMMTTQGSSAVFNFKNAILWGASSKSEFLLVLDRYTPFKITTKWKVNTSKKINLRNSYEERMLLKGVFKNYY